MLAPLPSPPSSSALRTRGPDGRPFGSDVDDEELVRRALAGEPRAKDALVARVMREVRFAASAVLMRHPTLGDDVRDLVQDVFVVLFERDGRELRRWDPARGRSLPSFVRLIARRRVRRVLEGHRGTVCTDPHRLDGADDEPQRRLEDRDRLARVLEGLLERLHERDRQLFTLLFVEQHDPADVARRLQTSSGAVNAWAYRFRNAVRARGTVVASPPDHRRGVIASGRSHSAGCD